MLFCSSEFYSMYERPIDMPVPLDAPLYPFGPSNGIKTPARGSTLACEAALGMSHKSPSSTFTLEDTFMMKQEGNSDRVGHQGKEPMADSTLHPEVYPTNRGAVHGTTASLEGEGGTGGESLYPWCFYRRMMRQVLENREKGMVQEGESAARDFPVAVSSSPSPSSQRGDRAEVRAAPYRTAPTFNTDTRPPSVPAPTLAIVGFTTPHDKRAELEEENDDDRYSSVSEAFYAKEAQASASRLASHLRKQENRFPSGNDERYGGGRGGGGGGAMGENHKYESQFCGDVRVELQQAKLMEEMTELLLFIRQRNQLSTQLTRQLTHTKWLLSQQDKGEAH